MGDSEIVLTGGTDNMSASPYAVRDIRFAPSNVDKFNRVINVVMKNLFDTTLTFTRFGTRLGADPKLEDMMWTSLTDLLSKTPMGVTAENLAAKYGVTREESDNFSLRSVI